MIFRVKIPEKTHVPSNCPFFLYLHWYERLCTFHTSITIMVPATASVSSTLSCYVDNTTRDNLNIYAQSTPDSKELRLYFTCSAQSIMKFQLVK